jgi:arylsulfatase A-like enzyme
VAPFWPPTNHGFDFFYGIPYSHDMTPLSVFEANGPEVKTVQERADLPTLQKQFVEQAEGFIDRNKDRPFFLELALSAPHLPEHPRPPFQGQSKIGAYGDVVEEIDAVVGRVLAKLKAHGLDDDTLVIFTSDNGPWYEGSSGGLRDRKASGAWDGASRVPFVARWPGHVPAGRRSDALASGLDFLPTFCGFAGKPAPAGVKLDGKDIGALLAGKGPSPHDQILLFNDEDIAGVRTDRWKLVMQSYYRNGTVALDGRYPQLYDMKLGDQESYSVDQVHPEVMKDMMNRWNAARREFEPLRSHPSAIKRAPPPAMVQD